MSTRTLRGIGYKRFIIYKNHIFPGFNKPLRSLQQIIMYKNPQLDRQKSRKMCKILDDQQIRRLRNQRIIHNQKINLQLDQYYKNYIQPMEICPDYYNLRWEYIKVKADVFVQSQIDINKKQQEPFYLNKEEYKEVKRRFNQKIKKNKIYQNNNNNNRFSQYDDDEQDDYNNQKYKNNLSQQSSSHYLTQKQRLIYLINKSLYPFQCLQILRLYEKLYKQYLSGEQFLLQQLFDHKISYIRPFIFYSPLQLFQSQHNELKLKECKQKLQKDYDLRQKNMKEFVGYLENRKKQLEILAIRHGVEMGEILAGVKKQYLKEDQYQSFYRIIKNA